MIVEQTIQRTPTLKLKGDLPFMNIKMIGLLGGKKHEGMNYAKDLGTLSKLMLDLNLEFSVKFQKVNSSHHAFISCGNHGQYVGNFSWDTVDIVIIYTLMDLIIKYYAKR